jgi:hypothetical protein
VREIYRLSAELMPLSEIARTLTERGILTRRRTIKRRQDNDETTVQEIGGNRFHDDILRRMICNPLYRGVLRFNEQEYAGQHEAIVSAEIWEAANAVIAESNRPLLSGAELAIFEAVNALGMATPAQIVTATQMSRATVTRGLTRLIQTGALQRQGATRSARYFTTQTKKHEISNV